MMRLSRWNLATLLSMACFGMLWMMFGSSFVNSPGSSAAAAPQTVPKECEFDLAKPKACTISKSGMGHIRWKNSSSGLLSVHFEAGKSPFEPPRCWDVLPNNSNNPSATTGAITGTSSDIGISYPTYISTKECIDNPPSNEPAGGKGTPIVIIN